jgi:hypothetical protein
MNQTPIMVKLGGNSERGFYPETNKPYTEIVKGKMPHNVLSILSNDIISLELGLSELTISDRLLIVQPDLAVDDYGYSTTLPMLLKDFIKGELVEKCKNGKFKITKIGLLFVKHNTKKD